MFLELAVHSPPRLADPNLHNSLVLAQLDPLETPQVNRDAVLDIGAARDRVVARTSDGDLAGPREEVGPKGSDQCLYLIHARGSRDIGGPNRVLEGAEIRAIGFLVVVAAREEDGVSENAYQVV